MLEYCCGQKILISPHMKPMAATIMKVAVTWEMCGYVDIEAKTMEEAMEKFEDEVDHVKLPENGEYVAGSFQLSSDDVEEMEAMEAFCS